MYSVHIQGGRKKGCFKVLEQKLLTKNNNKIYDLVLYRNTHRISLSLFF
jgi:hypothetical protein